jgi:hypothetical protein
MKPSLDASAPRRFFNLEQADFQQLEHAASLKGPLLNSEWVTLAP